MLWKHKRQHHHPLGLLMELGQYTGISIPSVWHAQACLAVWHERACTAVHITQLRGMLTGIIHFFLGLIHAILVVHYLQLHQINMPGIHMARSYDRYIKDLIPRTGVTYRIIYHPVHHAAAEVSRPGLALAQGFILFGSDRLSELGSLSSYRTHCLDFHFGYSDISFFLSLYSLNTYGREGLATAKL